MNDNQKETLEVDNVPDEIPPPLKLVRHDRKLEREDKFHPTPDELDRLEEAIFNCDEEDPDRITYHKVFDGIDQLVNFDTFLNDFDTRKEKALRYCWDVLKWRPSYAGPFIWKKTPFSYSSSDEEEDLDALKYEAK